MIAVFCSDEYFSEIMNELEINNLKVSLLVSETSKAFGRGSQKKDNRAVLFAHEKKIEVLTPSVLDNKFVDDFRSIKERLKVDFGIVFAYGKIIPSNLIAQFNNKLINIHPSLLPKYRGATPIQSAILNGESMTGYSIIEIVEKLDAGKILAQETEQIDSFDDYCSLKSRILKKAISNLPNVINNFNQIYNQAKEQIETEATFTRKFTKADGFLNDAKSAKEALLKIKAFSSWPRAYFELDNKRLIVLEASLENGKLKIDKVQLEGKNPIDFKSFKNGYSQLLTSFPPYVSI